jgi:hypothetical protein
LEHHTKANLLLISYSNTLCEFQHVAAQPTVFVAKQRNSKPSFFHAAAAASAYARLITVYLAGGGSGSPQMGQVEQWSARMAFSRKGRHLSLLSHLDVVLSPPMTRLMYLLAVSSAEAPPLSL